MSLTRKNVTAVGVVTLLLAATPVATAAYADPSTSPSPSTSTASMNGNAVGSPAFGVTRTADGWVHYTHLFSARLSLRGKHNRTLQGIKNLDGSCTMSDSGTVAAGGMGQYSEPLAVNSDLCQEMLLTGTLTQASAAQLAAANAALSDASDVSSAFGFAPARVKSAPAQALGATT